jgi:hypothetical protein
LENRPGPFFSLPCCHTDRFKRQRNTPFKSKLPHHAPPTSLKVSDFPASVLTRFGRPS